MMIVNDKPGLQQTCRGCTTVYLLQPEDVSLEVPINDDFARDLRATWRCPSCGGYQGDWLWELPSNWRKELKEKMSPDELEKKKIWESEQFREASRVRRFEAQFGWKPKFASKQPEVGTVPWWMFWRRC